VERKKAHFEKWGYLSNNKKKRGEDQTDMIATDGTVFSRGARVPNRKPDRKKKKTQGLAKK